MIKKALSWLLSAALSLTLVASMPLWVEADAPDAWDGTVATQYAGGAGTAADPYLISNGEELAYLAQQVNNGDMYSEKYFKQTNDIDLNDQEWTPIGTGYSTTPARTFKGYFNGNQYEIRGLKINSGSTYRGLFGYTSYADLTNICIIDCNISSGGNSGALVGTISQYTQIKNCCSSGTITTSGDKVGGLVGEYLTSAINNSYSTVTVTGRSYVGGLVGRFQNGQMSNCYSMGAVSGTGVVGALIGGTVDGYDGYYLYWNTTNNNSVNAIGSLGAGENLTIGQSDAQMKDSTFADTLNTNRGPYKEWTFSAGINNDYPVFVPADRIVPMLTPGTVNRTSDTDATVKFTSDEAGSYYYDIVNDEADVPSIDTTGAGSACSTSETTITIGAPDLSAGAKDIYLKVKDASGNISAALKIDIPDFVSSTPITIVSVAGITNPTAGAVPDITADDGSDYTAGAVSWTPNVGTFGYATQYTATVTLTANGGYTFTGLTNAAINGNTATIASNDGNTVILSYQFSGTEAAPPPAQTSSLGGGGGSNVAPTIAVSKVESKLFRNTELIMVEADMTNAFSKSVEVKITETDETSDSTFRLLVDNETVYPFDISIYTKSSTVKVQPKDGFNVTITLPVPESLLADKEKVKVAYLKDGKLVTLSSKLVQKSEKWCITFEAEHFSPYALIVREEMKAATFTDIKATDWFYDSVTFVYSKNLLKGTNDTKFSPHSNTNRGMIVTVLYRLAGASEPINKDSFDDIKPGDWYEDSAAWAKENKIASGLENDRFSPQGTVTREQLACFLYRYAEYKGYDVTSEHDLSAFNDVSQVSAWAQKAVRWAVSEGLISGNGNGSLDPKGNAERAQVATILKRFVENVE